MLIEFIFTSATPEPLAWTELEILRHECERRNKIESITGMLLYDGRNFMQVMEGREQKVIALFKLIASDPRHCNVEAIISNPIEKRNFNNWSMGVITLNDSKPTQHVTELNENCKKPLSFKLLYAFAHQEIQIDE